MNASTSLLQTVPSRAHANRVASLRLQKNIYHIRLLLNCIGLEVESSYLRACPTSNLCKLCNSSPETVAHFLAFCPALAQARSEVNMPRLLASVYSEDKPRFIQLVLGTEWVPDESFQHSCIELIYHLTTTRTGLLLLTDSISSAQT